MRRRNGHVQCYRQCRKRYISMEAEWREHPECDLCFIHSQHYRRLFLHSHFRYECGYQYCGGYVDDQTLAQCNHHALGSAFLYRRIRNTHAGRGCQLCLDNRAKPRRKHHHGCGHRQSIKLGYHGHQFYLHCHRNRCQWLQEHRKHHHHRRSLACRSGHQHQSQSTGMLRHCHQFFYPSRKRTNLSMGFWRRHPGWHHSQHQPSLHHQCGQRHSKLYCAINHHRYINGM